MLFNSNTRASEWNMNQYATYQYHPSNLENQCSAINLKIVRLMIMDMSASKTKQRTVVGEQSHLGSRLRNAHWNWRFRKQSMYYKQLTPLGPMGFQFITKEKTDRKG